MKKELAKTYAPKDFEERIYRDWEEKGYFHAERDPAKKPYTIVMPPPNITGQLHMGHALDCTLQDILIRFKRMEGYAALWLPGTDHAALATEAKIVSAMKEEGVTKHQLGREGFLKRAWDWNDKYGNRIKEQQRKMGSSCDWDRDRFTMDEGCSKAVQKVFIDLYRKGLIYRGERIINWCPACKTSISDIETEYEEQDGFFWHINYPIADGSGYVEIATTRPETLLGDSAVAVNPKDERYTALVGKTLKLPLTDREIPVVADEYVDPDFGTGCVKITPAHDPNDFEVGKRHNLPVIHMMNDDATINAEYGGKYAGLDRYAARKAIVADLEAAGLLVKVEPHKHNVGTCQRCGTTVEPTASLQWFVKMKELAKPAIDVVKSGELRFVPRRFENSYLYWMENIRDWCISRQIWWGHRIPAYYCQNKDCGHTEITLDGVEKCPKCGAAMIQDDDTLDTWFSSALWPFSTLGWPEKTPDYDYFYPTQTLVTGYDIITFWVSRMIFSGLEHTGEKPFQYVLIHGLVRDEQGRKMSKSLGNGVDPLEIIDRYGADALRLTLVTGNSPGNDMRWSEAKITASRNFANKLWNASRYILMNLPDDFEKAVLPDTLAIEDKWILTLYNRLISEVTDNLESFELGVAIGKLYDFIWDIYCDWYIELTKPRIAAGGETARAAQNVLVFVIQGVLKLLHPFMPFITEEIWRSMPVADQPESIMVAKWCEADDALAFPKEAEAFTKIIDAIRAVRAQRSELNVPPSKRVSMHIETADTALFEDCKVFFERLAGAGAITVSESPIPSEGTVTAVTSAARVFMPLGELVDREKELLRLEKERKTVQKDIDFLSGKLGNEGFLAKAPAAQVESERAKLAKAEEKMRRVLESIEALK
ncbi:MAG: valine--tRNA ligase [Bacteroides sp.]|nr:valine--tRNA ligase [Eubacterium sp.]MCM1418392.1 valine--tRNA ligase [Roseburia sp.]MCM1462493.1 valine--tRNA ligase [Bacteroides sp.]